MNLQTHLQQKSEYLSVTVIGIILIGCFSGLNVLSKYFRYDELRYDQPVLAMVGILIFSGLIYLFFVRNISQIKMAPKMLILIIGTGLVLRGLMFFSVPMLEDDYYRYLWDGAVTANGYSPYEYSPIEILEGDDRTPDKLKSLGLDSRHIIQRINHPHLRTIYPPLSQAVFSLAYWLHPWHIISWRIILFVFDAITLVLLGLILKGQQRPLTQLAIYWLNPLFIKEIYNSAHMDLIIFPFVLGAMFLSQRRHHIGAVILLALATGVKIWPIILMPLILKPIVKDLRQLIPVLLGFGVFFYLIFFPGYLSNLDSESGLRAYSQSWENNASFFSLILWGAQWVLPIFDVHPGHGQILSRMIIILFAICWMSFFVCKRSNSDDGIFARSLGIVAVIFLVSPTQFPWYYTWLIPFLTIRPSFSLLILTILLPLYYTRYYLEPRNMIDLFHHVIVWIEFVPVWLLLLFEFTLQLHKKHDKGG